MTKELFFTPCDHTILVIDPNFMEREKIAYQLQKLTFKTLGADSAQMALTMLRTFPVTLLIMAAPEEVAGSGLILNTLEAQQVPLPLILLVPEGSNLPLMQETEWGDLTLVQYLQRPINERDLRDKVLRTLFPPTPLQRRIFDRVDLCHRGNWTSKALPDFAEGTIVNLSQKGAFVASDTYLPLRDEVIELEFYFEEGELVLFQALGIVRWVRQNAGDQNRAGGFGMQFLVLGEAAEELVKKICPPPKTTFDLATLDLGKD